MVVTQSFNSRYIHGHVCVYFHVYYAQILVRLSPDYGQILLKLSVDYGQIVVDLQVNYGQIFRNLCSDYTWLCSFVIQTLIRDTETTMIPSETAETNLTSAFTISPIMLWFLLRSPSDFRTIMLWLHDIPAQFLFSNRGNFCSPFCHSIIYSDPSIVQSSHPSMVTCWSHLGQMLVRWSDTTVRWSDVWSNCGQIVIWLWSDFRKLALWLHSIMVNCAWLVSMTLIETPRQPRQLRSLPRQPRPT